MLEEKEKPFFEAQEKGAFPIMLKKRVSKTKWCKKASFS